MCFYKFVSPKHSVDPYKFVETIPNFGTLADLLSVEERSYKAEEHAFLSEEHAFLSEGHAFLLEECGHMEDR